VAWVRFLPKPQVKRDTEVTLSFAALAGNATCSRSSNEKLGSSVVLWLVHLVMSIKKPSDARVGE